MKNICFEYSDKHDNYRCIITDDGTTNILVLDENNIVIEQDDFFRDGIEGVLSYINNDFKKFIYIDKDEFNYVYENFYLDKSGNYQERFNNIFKDEMFTKHCVNIKKGKGM